MNNTQIQISDDDIGARLDVFVSRLSERSRTNVQIGIVDGDIVVNGDVVGKNYKLRKNDTITITIPPVKELALTEYKTDIEVVFEDEHLLVVNKPKGMVVHPAQGNYDCTLVNWLLYHCKDSLSGINGVQRPGIVHRIDKQTSGLLIVAKNDIAHIGLAEQIKAHTFTREYEAVVIGRVKDDNGTINVPIGRDKRNRKRMAVTMENSKEAITHYDVIERFEHSTHIRLKLYTGRTHQIRVHLAYIGYPVLGDSVYGKADKRIDGQCLHAKSIGFIHPITLEELHFESKLPEYFRKIINGEK